MKLAALLLLGLAAPALAEKVYLSHQGRLLNPDDTVAEGQHDVTVSIYATETAEQASWFETYPVTLFRGTYAILIGDTKGGQKSSHPRTSRGNAGWALPSAARR